MELVYVYFFNVKIFSLYFCNKQFELKVLLYSLQVSLIVRKTPNFQIWFEPDKKNGVEVSLLEATTDSAGKVGVNIRPAI